MANYTIISLQIFITENLAQRLITMFLIQGKPNCSFLLISAHSVLLLGCVDSPTKPLNIKLEFGFPN